MSIFKKLFGNNTEQEQEPEYNSAIDDNQTLSFDEPEENNPVENNDVPPEASPEPVKPIMNASNKNTGTIPVSDEQQESYEQTNDNSAKHVETGDKEKPQEPVKYEPIVNKPVKSVRITRRAIQRHVDGEDDYEPSWEWDDNLPAWRNELLSYAFKTKVNVDAVQGAIGLIDELTGFSIPAIGILGRSVSLTWMNESGTVFIIVNNESSYDCWHIRTDGDNRMIMNAELGTAFDFMSDEFNAGTINILEVHA